MGKIFSAMQKAGKGRPLELDRAFAESPDAAASGREPVAASAPGPAQRVSAIHPVNEKLVTIGNANSFEAEMFKILRSKLLFPARGNPPRTILVTSLSPGDGKSFVAANLAVSIAQGIDEHVLLIDSDLRNPSAHKMFGYPNTLGLSDHLKNRLPLDRALLKTQIPKLTLLPGGTQVDNPAELVASSPMFSLIEEVKNRYPDRYVLIDSPPPQLTAETTALARQVDGILFVVRTGHTRRKQAAELIDKLGREKIIGVVLNGIQNHFFKYYGYRGYKQGYQDAYAS